MTYQKEQPKVENVLISVLMPVYNTEEKYLREAIESILNQTFKNYEFIIINDGSTNNAETVILSYDDARIIYKKQENKGIAKTRNILLNLARGKYFVWMDSDDIAMTNRLELQYYYLESHPEISLLGGQYTFLIENNESEPTQIPLKLGLLEFNSISQPTVMGRLEDLKNYNLHFNENLTTAEDPEFFSRALRFLKAENMKECLIKYRVLDNSLSHDVNTKKIRFLHSHSIYCSVLEFLSPDIHKQLKILEILNPLKIKDRIFSVKTKYLDYRKCKVITFLGFKIIFNTKNTLLN